MNGLALKTVTRKMPVTSLEVNNNSEDMLKHMEKTYRARSESRDSTVSSASSSEASDDLDVNHADLKSTEVTNEKEDKDSVVQEPEIRRNRSKSDGAPTTLPTEERFEVFPSLPDSVLDKMGLLGDGSTGHSHEDDLEHKFVSLSLAFTTDAATIKDRCERQSRYRDQTEMNFNSEINRLVDKINKMHRLCVDGETTELLTNLLAQVEIVARAASMAAVSSARYGAVQHEDRLAQSVRLMVNYVNSLKQQRDSVKRQLQYTKKMLQESHSADSSPTKSKTPVLNGPNLNRRRASIATISQQYAPPNSLLDLKKITRRTSELSMRPATSPRTSRPTRLELGVDLVEIREGTGEGTEQSNPPGRKDSETCANEQPITTDYEVEQEVPPANVDVSSLTLKERIYFSATNFRNTVTDKYKMWSDRGTLHEIFAFMTLMCFSLGMITLGNIFVELEYGKISESDCDDNWTYSCIWAKVLSLIGESTPVNSSKLM